jgi:hypothetical protein
MATAAASALYRRSHGYPHVKCTNAQVTKKSDGTTVHVHVRRYRFRTSVLIRTHFHQSHNHELLVIDIQNG